MIQQSSLERPDADRCFAVRGGHADADRSVPRSRPAAAAKPVFLRSSFNTLQYGPDIGRLTAHGNQRIVGGEIVDAAEVGPGCPRRFQTIAAHRIAAQAFLRGHSGQGAQFMLDECLAAFYEDQCGPAGYRQPTGLSS